MTDSRGRPRRSNGEDVKQPHGGEAERRVPAGEAPDSLATDEASLPSSVVLPSRSEHGLRRVATYRYDDLSGAVVLLVNRFGTGRSKTFSQGHVRDGRYVSGKGDGPPVLYRLASVRRAAEQGEVVWLCEGEKDVLALEELGEVATCNPGGAKKWADEYTDALKGVPCVRIVWDRDRTGADHALKVAAELSGVVPRIEFFRAKQGNDAFDHLAAGLGLADLVKVRPKPAKKAAKATPVKRPAKQRRDSPLELVLSLLEGLQRTSDGWEARCPAHDDTNPSLSVAEGETQPVVFHCHAGCSPEAVADALDLPLSVLCGTGSVSLTTTPLSEVEQRAYRWMWPDRIAYEKLTIFDGDPEQGKSLMTTDLAARLSVGAPMPGSDVPQPVGVTLILSAEDDPGDTIAPRIVAAGGDLTKVHIVDARLGPNGYEIPLVLPDDVGHLEAAIRESGASLVIIDPLAAFFAERINPNSDASVRQALGPLRQVAQSTGAAIILVRHLNKSIGGPAIYRGGGSIGIVGIARLGFLISRSPADRDLRIMAASKNNLGLRAESVTFRVGPNADGLPVIEWVGTSSLSADDLVLGRPDARLAKPRRDAAQEFLAQLIDERAAIAKSEIDVLAEQAGYSFSTIQRAADELGVAKFKVINAKGRVEQWLWHFEPDEFDRTRFYFDLDRGVVLPVRPLRGSVAES